jgi:hypothetical protein
VSGDDNEHTKQEFVCSNPNCKSVFSRPKIIKYQVCPTCQTVLSVTADLDRGETEIIAEIRKLLDRLQQEPVDVDSPQDTAGAEIQESDSILETEESSESGENLEKDEQVVVAEQTKFPESEPETHDPGQTPITLDVEEISRSPSGCQYGYGYLRHRGKSEGIPDSCVECSKALDCMLSDYYQEKESVKEIKKWYDLKEMST